MIEVETILLVLGLLYVSECLVWVGKRTVLFTSPWCRRWRATTAGPFFGNDRGSLSILNPLPPLGTAFAGHGSPLSLSPEGVCDLHLQDLDGSSNASQSGAVLAFAEITAAGADGKHLLLNGARFSRCAAPGQAATLARLVDRAARAPAHERETIIRDFVDAQFSKADALRRLDQILPHAAPLRWRGILFFLLLFGLVPVAACLFDLSLIILPVAVVMLGTAVLILVAYVRAHRAVHPEWPDDRLINGVKMILCPPAAVRAGDLLTIEAMSRFHPVLLADILLGAGAARLCRPLLRDLRHPLRHGLKDPRAVAVVTWYAGVELDACTRYLKAAAPALLDTIFEPPPWDGVSTSCCPRCGGQFTRSGGEDPECPDCPGVPLRPVRSQSTEAARPGEPHP